MYKQFQLVTQLLIYPIKGPEIISETCMSLFPFSDDVLLFSIYSTQHYIYKRVTEFKYLGVVFDEHLSWNEHVKAILSKAGRRVGLL